MAPYLEDILTEKSLASEPTGLKGLFQKCLKLASTTLSPLLELTQGSSGSAASRDFSFLVRLVPKQEGLFAKFKPTPFKIEVPDEFIDYFENQYTSKIFDVL